MRDVSERRKELEKEHGETLSSLRDKQNELQWRSNCSASEKVKICETIEALQVNILRYFCHVDWHHIDRFSIVVENQRIGEKNGIAERTPRRTVAGDGSH